jgi:hypothetical protein
VQSADRRRHSQRQFAEQVMGQLKRCAMCALFAIGFHGECEAGRYGVGRAVLVMRGTS